MGTLAGALAGVVGAWAMDVYWSAIARLKERSSAQTEPLSDDDATVRAASAVSRKILGRGLTKDEKEVAGPAVHFAMGALSGGLYGLLAELVPRLRRDRGLALGSALWLAADEMAVPLLRLSKSPAHYPLSSHAEAFGAHITYGVTTDLVRRVIRANLAVR